MGQGRQPQAEDQAPTGQEDRQTEKAQEASRLSGILQPVYEEILNDVKQGTKIWADETGWRLKGKLWWLWIFANERSAYNWPDRTRGGPVVERLLGEVFFGILIVDGWHAYTKIVCARQTCMAYVLSFARYAPSSTRFPKIAHFPGNMARR